VYFAVLHPDVLEMSRNSFLFHLLSCFFLPSTASAAVEVDLHWRLSNTVFSSSDSC